MHVSPNKNTKIEITGNHIIIMYVLLHSYFSEQHVSEVKTLFIVTDVLPQNGV